MTSSSSSSSSSKMAGSSSFTHPNDATDGQLYQLPRPNQSKNTTFPTRRGSTFMSLPIPIRRRSMRIIVVVSICVLFVLTVNSTSRNRRKRQLIEQTTISTFTWPSWVGAEHASGLWLDDREETRGSSHHEHQRIPKSPVAVGLKLKRGLEDLGLMPIVLDSGRHARGTRESSSGDNNNDEETDSHSDHEMPWFWGNTDERGYSPFDHRPYLREGQQGKRVLMLTGKVH